MVDRTLILRKLAELDEFRAQAGEFDDLSAEAYAGDWRTQRIVERTLQIMIEACVDVAHHLISDRGFRIPETYAETFRVLGEQGVISAELATSLEGMARFRNLLVHHYGRIDATAVTGFLRNRLGDFDAFRDAVLAAL